MFVLGCNNLIVVTDHQPLLGVFCNCDLGTISNPQLQKPKSQTLSYYFTTQYCLGKRLSGPDAMSQNPSAIYSIECTEPTLEILRQAPTAQELLALSVPESNVEAHVVAAVNVL